jgi:hypothetical protein
MKTLPNVFTSHTPQCLIKQHKVVHKTNSALTPKITSIAAHLTKPQDGNHSPT